MECRCVADHLPVDTPDAELPGLLGPPSPAWRPVVEPAPDCRVTGADDHQVPADRPVAIRRGRGAHESLEAEFPSQPGRRGGERQQLRVRPRVQQAVRGVVLIGELEAGREGVGR